MVSTIIKDSLFHLYMYRNVVSMSNTSGLWWIWTWHVTIFDGKIIILCKSRESSTVCFPPSNLLQSYGTTILHPQQHSFRNTKCRERERTTLKMCLTYKSRTYCIPYSSPSLISIATQTSSNFEVDTYSKLYFLNH